MKLKDTAVDPPRAPMRSATSKAQQDNLETTESVLLAPITTLDHEK